MTYMGSTEAGPVIGLHAVLEVAFGLVDEKAGLAPPAQQNTVSGTTLHDSMAFLAPSNVDTSAATYSIVCWSDFAAACGRDADGKCISKAQSNQLERLLC